MEERKWRLDIVQKETSSLEFPRIYERYDFRYKKHNLYSDN